MDGIEAYGRGDDSLPDSATERERALLGYARALTLHPGKMTVTTLDPLRRAGLDDTAILEANQVAAYFAYVNRVVDGLGVQLESHHRT